MTRAVRFADGMARVLEDPRALVESLPKPVDRLGRAGLPIARMGAAFLARKYHYDTDALAQQEQQRTIDRGHLDDVHHVR